jgi:hypothetical protein
MLNINATSINTRQTTAKISKGKANINKAQINMQSKLT